MTEEILRTEFSEEFIAGMRQRMIVSYYKYGPVTQGFPENVDAMASAMQRLRLYARGDTEKDIPAGNSEYLMDAANFLMIEFMRPRHPEAHFKGTDDDGSPGRIAAGTGRPDKRGNETIGK